MADEKDFATVLVPGEMPSCGLVTEMATANYTKQMGVESHRNQENEENKQKTQSTQSLNEIKDLLVTQLHFVNITLGRRTTFHIC